MNRRANVAIVLSFIAVVVSAFAAWRNNSRPLAPNTSRPFARYKVVLISHQPFSGGRALNHYALLDEATGEIVRLTRPKTGHTLLDEGVREKPLETWPIKAPPSTEEEAEEIPPPPTDEEAKEMLKRFMEETAQQSSQTPTKPTGLDSWEAAVMGIGQQASQPTSRPALPPLFLKYENIEASGQSEKGMGAQATQPSSKP